MELAGRWSLRSVASLVSPEEGEDMLTPAIPRNRRGQSRNAGAASADMQAEPAASDGNRLMRSALCGRIAKLLKDQEKLPCSVILSSWSVFARRRGRERHLAERTAAMLAGHGSMDTLRSCFARWYQASCEGFAVRVQVMRDRLERVDAECCNLRSQEERLRGEVERWRREADDMRAKASTAEKELLRRSGDEFKRLHDVRLQLAQLQKEVATPVASDYGYVDVGAIAAFVSRRTAAAANMQLKLCIVTWRARARERGIPKCLVAESCLSTASAHRGRAFLAWLLAVGRGRSRASLARFLCGRRPSQWRSLLRAALRAWWRVPACDPDRSWRMVTPLLSMRATGTEPQAPAGAIVSRAPEVSVAPAPTSVSNGCSLAPPRACNVFPSPKGGAGSGIAFYIGDEPDDCAGPSPWQGGPLELSPSVSASTASPKSARRVLAHGLGDDGAAAWEGVITHNIPAAPSQGSHAIPTWPNAVQDHAALPLRANPVVRYGYCPETPPLSRRSRVASASPAPYLAAGSDWAHPIRVVEPPPDGRGWAHPVRVVEAAPAVHEGISRPVPRRSASPRSRHPGIAVAPLIFGAQ
eukprot:TRINITY_DN25071_c0_g1_i1.p1 TRINITY_DN25071_c0_g1~~TRINITY_DN25071_c0_g1_i1.p1  ORF type:complete len:583 (-),score=74.76 TRINITY_DN25071_c0_g1_i1:209-1957(-)